MHLAVVWWRREAYEATKLNRDKNETKRNEINLNKIN